MPTEPIGRDCLTAQAHSNRISTQHHKPCKQPPTGSLYVTCCAVLITSSLLQEQNYAIAEASIYASVAEGYYVPSLNAITVEGETGLVMGSLQAVETGTSEDDFPNFSGRGYAILQYGSAEQVQ